MTRPSIILLILAFLHPAVAAAQRPPVIDMHLHAYLSTPPGASADWADRADARALMGRMDADQHMTASLAEMDNYNVVLAVVSGPAEAVRKWEKAAPGRIIGGAFLGENGLPELSVDSLRTLVDAGVIGVFGELGLQYEGISPSDERLDPYYDYLEESGVPLALHTGLGPPGGPYTFAPKFRVTLGRPTLFEPVKATRPHLKAYLMHAGWPYLEETKAMLYIYPDLYVDVAVLDWSLTSEAFYSALRELVEAGFEKRILFGTDQMLWPGAIGLAVETIENAPFLSDMQKRDILYNNAARFLGLSEAEVSAHHDR